MTCLAGQIFHLCNLRDSWLMLFPEVYVFVHVAGTKDVQVTADQFSQEVFKGYLPCLSIKKLRTENLI